MNGEGSISEGKAILSRDQKDPGPARLPRALLRPPKFYEGRGLSVGQVSRRTFIRGLGAIGPAFVAYSLCGRPFSVVPFSVGLRRMKLRRMNFGVAGTTAERAVGSIFTNVQRSTFNVQLTSMSCRLSSLPISYFVIRISYFERRKTNNASRGRPTC